jgi:4-hydroxy-tetrahydrodipicolinate reductase
MGQKIIELVEDKPGIRICAAIDLVNDDTEVHNTKVKTYYSMDKISVPVDVIIDAGSTPHAGEIKDLIKLATRLQKPIVMTYESYTKEDKRLIEEASKYLPIFTASHLSLNTYLFMEYCKSFAQIWRGDIEIVEANCGSKEVPCETAIRMAETMVRARGYGRIVVGRVPADGLRQEGDICITSVRGGIVAGEYELRFFNGDCQVHVSIREYGRSSFASGAIKICEFMSKVTIPGLYGVEHIIEARRKSAVSSTKKYS